MVFPEPGTGQANRPSDVGRAVHTGLIVTRVCLGECLLRRSEGKRGLTEKAKCSMFVRETGHMTHSRVFYLSLKGL